VSQRRFQRFEWDYGDWNWALMGHDGGMGLLVYEYNKEVGFI
jgi:hypothetical protein